MNQNPLLMLIFVPIACGVFCMLLPDRIKSAIKAIVFLVTAWALVSSISVFMHKPLAFQTNSSILFLADNLSSFIGMGIAFFAFLIAIYSFGFVEKSFGRYFGYFLITLGSSMGAAFANNTIILMTFWGLLAVLLYLLVAINCDNRASASAKKALIIIGGTDALMLFGIALIWAMSGTFAMDSVRLPLTGVWPIVAYISIAIAALAKAGAMPFHSWLPDVAEDGPTPVTAYLPASLDKLLGIYLLARVSLDMFVMNKISNFILLLIGSVTIILAVVFALVQHDMKRLLGYHAVSQVGYMVLGIGTGNPVGIAGGIFHMFNHAIYKSCLFLSGGDVEKKAGSTDLDKLGGLAKFMPVTFLCFLVASLSISGIPPFNGFVSKWMIYQGIIEGAQDKNPFWIVWLAAAMFGSSLTIASFMKLIHAIFLGRPSSSMKNVKEAGFSMLLPITILASLCFLLGVFAFTFSLPVLILPSIGKMPVYLGTWAPVMATILILVGIIPGFFIYLMLKKGKFRTTGVFIGGEDADKLERVTGSDFYNTVKDFKGLGRLYEKEENRSLDIYDLSRRAINIFTGALKRLHNGILPTYLVWCLVGMVLMFLFVFFR